MIPKAYPSESGPSSATGAPASGERSDRPCRAVGADVGATLAKLAIGFDGGEMEFRILPAHAIERVAREVESVRPERIGLTGGGASEIASLLEMDTERVMEFDAWYHGAEEMLRRQGLQVPQPYLLVSVGTGTSAMLVHEGKITRIGGTALGGGTILGLGAGLLGVVSFAELSHLARKGDRRAVDLLVGDLDPAGDIPLPREMNASSFAKLARDGATVRAQPADLAHAVMGLVGENVGIICGALAVSARAERVVYAGSSLRDNPALTEVLLAATAARGGRALLLPEGEFAGALGAMLIAENQRPRGD